VGGAGTEQPGDATDQERVIRKPCHVLPAGVTSRILFPGASGTVIAGSAFLFRVTITELAVPWHWQQTLLPQRPDRTMSHHASCHQILIPVSRYQRVILRSACPVLYPTPPGICRWTLVVPAFARVCLRARRPSPPTAAAHSTERRQVWVPV
jgi:hypothetical protein